MRPNLACAAGVAAVAAVVGHSSTCSAFTTTVIPGSFTEGALTARASSAPAVVRPRAEHHRSRKSTTSSSSPWGYSFSSSSSRSRCCRGSPDGDQYRGFPTRTGMSMSSKGNGGDGFSRLMDGGKKWLASVAVASTLLGGSSMMSPVAPSMAATPTETKEIGLCLLSECRGELLSCLLNPKCFANIICLQTCNGRSDEGYCQIRCGDLFENEAVGKFNKCAVSQKNCVKQRQDDGSWPVPPIESQVKAFNPKMMEGQWYISAGLNPAFDCFDCQVHFFNSPKPGQLVGKLNWRIKEPDGEFFTRDVIQKFKQDPENPAHLVNKDNDYLHYRDDWYVLDAEPNSHVLVVYRGSNDAWDGYGGGTLYTKDKAVPPGLVDRLKEKSQAAGIDWERFQYNDNTCKPQTSDTAELLREKYAKKVLLSGGKQLQEQLTAVRGYAKQEADEVESSTLDKLEDLKQEYEVEVEQLGSDLVSAFEAELNVFESNIVDEAKSLAEGAVRIEKEAESILNGKD